MTGQGVSAPRDFRDGVRTFNKRVLNPVMLNVAGRRHWYTARLEHVGRRSGRAYATPIVASEVPGGFVIPLPYGTETDWLRNVLEAGGGALIVHGRRYALSAPEVRRTAERGGELPEQKRAVARTFGIAHYLRVAAVPVGDG
jgi:deazaflavin-dependent oxidoreductase (nitroreductase family)